MGKKWIVVGISGCTNSGKTTLANFLRDSFPGSIVVNQDKYFRPDDSEEHILIPELNHKNWERIEAVNWDAMMMDVTHLLNAEPVSKEAFFIIEGHIVFNCPKLSTIFHKKYFLTLNKEECFQRRITRVYDPPDIPGYFEQCIWPMYLSNLAEIKRIFTDLFILDGTRSVQDIREIVLHDLENYLR